MTTTVEAIYEQGILRLLRPIDLADGTRVEVVVTPCDLAPEDQPPRRKRTPAKVAAEIAALSMQSSPEGFSGEDHDRILYGEKGAR
jgi:predicted DNA-binding antitoxin AbrB/MazE fold protein